jgi:hypothetical protein
VRRPRWAELADVGRMMAKVYLRGPRPNAGRVLTWLVAVGFMFMLALLKPFVRVWIDSESQPRHVAVVIVPRGWLIVAALRFLVAVAPYAVVGGVLLALFPNGVTLTVAVTPVIVAIVALVTFQWASQLPYGGHISSSGPRVTGADVQLLMGASTVAGGMQTVRDYLLTHHGGQRVTARVRDDRGAVLYRKLGLRVVEPGSGRMTGIIEPSPMTYRAP